MPKLRPTGREKSGAEVAAATLGETLPDTFWNRVDVAPERVALRFKRLGIWNEVSWRKFGREVRACAYGLIALGIEPGDVLAILSEDRVEWFYADLGGLCSGAVSLGVYPTSSARQCFYVIAHSEAKVVIVEDQEQYDKVSEVRSGLDSLQYIIVIDPTGVRGIKDHTVMTFDALRARGRKLEETEPALLEERMARIHPDHTAILFYTSGTTGPPKGTMHSHRSFLAGLQALAQAVGVSENDEGICYLPLAHLAERVSSYSGLLLQGACGSCAESPTTLFRDLKEVAPTFFTAVPRTWEKLKAQVEINIDEATWLKRKVCRLALTSGAMWQGIRQNGGSPSLPARVLHLATEWMVIRKLRERLGFHRIRMAYSTAAPIASEVLEFFRTLGIPLREVYGMTETGVTAATRPGQFRLGTVGTSAPGVDLRIDENGELWCKGPGLLKGYLKDPEATAAVFNNGWFRTGDMGAIDENGHLHLTGRVSEMMITSSGRNVAPQNIENMLKASSYIMDAVVVAEARPYLSALIAIDEETVSHYAQTNGIPFSSFASLAMRPEIVELIAGEVRKVNKRWSDREQIQDFRILKWELTHDEEELTPTMKVRRKIICESYSELIEEMYPNA